MKLVEHGHSVTVVASSRAYDNPKIKFPKQEVWRGIQIVRIPCLGLGKKAKWRRALDFASFLVNCFLQVITLARFDTVVAMTTPPLISFLAALLVRLKGGRFVFWVMDLNPDEAVAAGWLRKHSASEKLLSTILLYSLRRAEMIVVLDRFMRRRIAGKGISEDKITVIPPWSHDDVIKYDPIARDVFREQYGLSNNHVVMYSGNHSPCHPLDTLLRAARRLAHEPEIAFCFVGGGSEFEKVQHFVNSHALKNVTCIPYQPLDKVSGSLSAADLHVVVLGDPFVGIVHPCKIYNILTLGIPFLYIGPVKSHLTDLIDHAGLGQRAFTARHGDVDTVVNHILASSRSVSIPKSEIQRCAASFSEDVLLTHM